MISFPIIKQTCLVSRIKIKTGKGSLLKILHYNLQYQQLEI